MTGYAFATAFAAPVEDGMMLAEAARPARQSLLFIDNFHKGCKAVGRARGARDDLHVGFVIFCVH